jgi:flagellar biosynthesis GTPase FlhF
MVKVSKYAIRRYKEIEGIQSTEEALKDLKKIYNKGKVIRTDRSIRWVSLEGACAVVKEDKIETYITAKNKEDVSKEDREESEKFEDEKIKEKLMEKIKKKKKKDEENEDGS